MINFLISIFCSMPVGVEPTHISLTGNGPKKKNILNSETCHATPVVYIQTGDGLRASQNVDGKTGVGSP